MDCTPPGSSVHGISQARILEWVACPSPEDLHDPEIEPRTPALQADSLSLELLGKPDEGIKIQTTLYRVCIIFHAKMGSIKDRNGRDLTKAEDIKRRWQEYTDLYKKDLHDPDNHDAVINHIHLSQTSWNVNSSVP